MKKIYLLLIYVFYCGILSAQSCLPNGIIFNTQYEIDNFATNYPGCTEVLGRVIIDRALGSSLTNLDALNQITDIQGDLRISNVGTITNLTALNNLTALGGSLIISGNYSLVDLSGLENLTSISGEIEIVNNNSLASLNGLDNLDYNGITYLSIHDNPNLTFCSVAGICGYLANGGASTLYFNAFACDDADDIAYSCVSPPPCPEPGILFRNQQQIDDFPLNYPTCTSLSNITIVSAEGEPPVTNLNGLSQITSITGDLYIHNTDSLQTLIGLNNLTSIGGYLQIGAYSDLYLGYPFRGGNKSLYSLEGLNNLTFIGDRLEMYGNNVLTDLTALSNLTSIGEQLKVNQNPNLLDFTGLENLTSIEGTIWISENNSLSSIAALSNIDYSGITHLRLYQNYNLSECSINSFCDFLYNNNEASLYDNGVGCNSNNEIMVGCLITNPCAISNLLYVNDQPVADGVYQASNQLNSGGIIPDGGAVDFKAGQTIRLDNGFKVEVNADFSAEIDDCN